MMYYVRKRAKTQAKVQTILLSNGEGTHSTASARSICKPLRIWSSQNGHYLTIAKKKLNKHKNENNIHTSIYT